MGTTPDGKDAWTFDVPGTRVYCYDIEGLVLYEATNDAAWVSAEVPCNLHEWA